MSAPIRVLVVDDDPSLRESLCELLADRGFRVSGADSGAAALRGLRAAPARPDVILLDLMMPVMNGWEFREAQLRDPELARIPVVVMTASREHRSIQADEIVHKPVKLATLIEVIRRHVRAAEPGGPAAQRRAPEPGAAPSDPAEPRAQPIGERELALLRELARRTAGGHTVDEVCADAARVLAGTRDLPFALVYVASPDRTRLELCGSGGGVEPGTPAAPEVIAPDDAAPWPLGDVLRDQATRVIDLDAWPGPLPGGARDRPSAPGALVPIAPGGARGRAGVLVAGLNPHRLFDDAYRGFLELVAVQISASIAGAQAYEAERQRAEALAELDRARSTFLGNVSHELRTPLALTLGPAHDLLAGLHGALTAAQREQLEVVHRNGLRLHELVDTLLDSSRLEAAAGAGAAPGAAPHVEASPGTDADAPGSARILLADDSDDLRDHIRWHLERHWIVEAVEDGAKALAAARANPPDLILTDVVMPGLDGFELLRALRADPRTGAIPVVMLSARSGEEARVEGLQAGADDYVTKPFSARELVARVAAHLETARLRAAVVWERDRLRALLGQAPAIINFLRGSELVFEYAHPRAIETLGGRQLVGKPLLEAIPEMRSQEFPALLRRVVETGERIEGRERRFLYDDGSGQLRESFWSFVYLPVRDRRGDIEGVMTFDLDVTDQALARHRLEQSEERFRRLVTQIRAGIAVTDLAGRFTLVNERFREIVGRSEAELLQLRMQDLTHPEDLPGNLEQFGRMLEHGTPFVIEKRYLKPDGSIVWVQNNVSRIEDRDGRPQGAAAVALDITQRKFADRALRESEARFRTIFEKVEVSLWEEDFSAVVELVDGLRLKGRELLAFLQANPAIVDRAIGLVRIRDVNPATLRLFGATTKEQLLGSLHAVFVPESRSVFIEELVALAERRTSFSAEAIVGTLSGERLDVMLTVGFTECGDHCERVLVSLVDISARKLADREREARLAEMERAVRFSEMFVGILGHDLRNPLSSIAMAAQLLEARAGSEAISGPVGRILGSAERMERMLTQLLDFTRIRLGRGLPLDRSRVDVAELARSISNELELVYRREIQLEAIGDPVGSWDRDRLSQLLSNLAGNACQHAAVGSPVRVQIDGAARDLVHLMVANAGAIPERLLPVVFEPLRTSDGRGRRDGASGLGLGLYITQQIALAHGGSIRVESTAAQGTRFIVTLPRDAPPSDGGRVFSSRGGGDGGGA